MYIEQNGKGWPKGRLDPLLSFHFLKKFCILGINEINASETL